MATRSWSARLASFVIRGAAAFAPADCRADWRREWLAELEARDAHASAARTLSFAAGAPMHALWLRRQAWTMTAVTTDVKWGVRTLSRRPLFAAASIVTLALGIGATTAIFSVVYGVLLKPLPYAEPSRLVQLWESNPLFNWTQETVAPGNVLSWRDRNTVFTGIALYDGSATHQGGISDATLDGDEPQRARALRVSANLFDVLGAPARLGRTFVTGEDFPGRHREVILSDGFWRRHFGGDPLIVGKSLSVNGVGREIIGVMPASFRFDQGDIDFWTPLAFDPAQLREIRVPHLWRAIARLKPGVTIEQANANLHAIAAELEREHPESNKQMNAGAGPLDDWFVGGTRRPLLLFLAAVGLVLLIACANVANLFLARSTERRGEMTLRAALGASRFRLVRAWLVEAALVATAGTALGIALAWGSVKAFVSFAPAGIPRIDDVAIQPIVLIFAVCLTAFTAILVTVAPALSTTRADLRTGLGAGTRTTGGSRRLRRTLVGAEVALATVLLVGATLTMRSFQALVHVDPGFPVQGLTTVKLSLPGARYGKDGDSSRFYEDLTTRVRAIPGVVAAGGTAKLPLEGHAWTGDLYIEQQSAVHGRELRHKSITAGYLDALGVRLLEGRTIDGRDRADTPQVVVINHTLANKFFAGTDPVGQRIAYDAPSAKVHWRTIVGVVSDEAQDGLGAPIGEEVYESHVQEETSEMSLLVRTAPSAPSPLPQIRQVIRDMDPKLAPYGMGTFADILNRSTMRERVSLWLIAAFAMVALVLAAVGVYGVTACSVTARTREIGVRIAFGAASADVLGLLLREEMPVVVIGLLAGASLAAVAGRAASALLFGVTPGDPASFAIGLLVLLVTGCLASLIPARRALRVDPVKALRVD